MSLALNIADLTVRSPEGRVLLSIPKLFLPPGSCVSVRGPSGAGKSTFLFALAGLAQGATGSLAWGDMDLIDQPSGRRAEFRRQNVGMIFQDFLLFEELSAAANAALPGAYATRRRERTIRQQAEKTLLRLGIAHGARTVESFSGGERQRVAVARALSADPAVILADEPTASLDRATADSLVDDLIRLVREDGKTLVAVSHDPAVHARVDRIIDIADGRIVAVTEVA